MFETWLSGSLIPRTDSRGGQAVRFLISPFLLFFCSMQFTLAVDSIEISLGELLRSFAAQNNVSFVLDPGLELDDRLVTRHHDWRDPAQLDEILAESGLRQQLNTQGDRLILRRSELQLELSELEIEAGRYSSGSVKPDLGRQLTSRTVIDADAIERSGDNQLNDLFLRAANVFGSRDDFYIRGVASNGDLNTLGNSNVFADGVPLAGNLLAILPVSTWDIDRVSFERGSLSARQPGPFASYAGAVYLEHRVPAYENSAGLLLRYDHLNDSQMSAALNRQLTEEELALRLTIDRLSRSGTVAAVDTGRQDVDAADSLSLRASLLWEPLEPGNLRLTAAVSAVEGEAGPQSFVIHQQSALDPFDREGFFPPINKQQARAWQGEFGVELEDSAGRDWQLGIAGSDSRLEIETSRSIANELLPDFDLVDQSDSSVYFANLGVAQDLGRPGRVELELSIGEVSEQQQVDRDRALWNTRSELRRNSLGLAYQYQFDSNVQAYARLRYDRDTLKNRCVVNGEGSGSIDGGPLSCTRLLGFYVSLLDHQALAPLKTRFDQWSPELALSWHSSDQLALFVRAYRGFNAGGAASSVTLDGRPFYLIYQPERSDNMELGADLDWVDGRLTGRITAFYTTLSNQWTPVLGGADFPLGQIENSGHSRLFGLEWDGRFEIDQRHELRFSLGYLNTSHVSFVPFERDADLENVAGNRFAGAPEFSGALSLSGLYGKHWRWSTALSHHSRAFANANNSLAGSIPAATLVDLKAGYRWRQLDVSLLARNLFDEKYLETTPRVIRGTGLVEYTLGRPRSFGIAIQYQF